MKALILSESRTVEACEVPVPKLVHDDDVLVRMSWITINRLDLFAAEGMPFARQKLPMIVGVEGAGVVAKAAPGVGGVSVGDRVVIYPGIICGQCRSCVAGQENRCIADPRIRGFNTDGVGAEYIKVSSHSLLPVEDGIRLRDAACVPVTAATVEHMINRNAKLQPGETILIQAGGSGIGSVAIGMAKRMGALVITTVGSDDKVEKALELGADHVINYRRDDFAAEVRKLTARRGVDVVFEHVGTETWEGSLSSLAIGGRLVTCGSHTGTFGRINILQLFNRHIHVLGSFGGNHADVRAALKMLAEGALTIPIDIELSWQELDIGMERLQSRGVFGKVVLKMPGWNEAEEFGRAAALSGAAQLDRAAGSVQPA